MGSSPGPQVFGHHRIYYSLGRESGRACLLAGVTDPAELSGGMAIAVDCETAARFRREGEEVVGRVQPLGPGVDFNGLVEAGAGGEDKIRVEGRLGAAAADEDAT